MSPFPAVSLVAVPGRRRRTVELAQEIEARGFAGIYSPGSGDVSLCGSLAHVTHRVPFGTSIQPIYMRSPIDMAATASYLHELSDGRFTLGLGVSHPRLQRRMPLPVGRPLADVRAYVGALRTAAGRSGPLPPIVLATLRDRMVELATEIAEGAVWANGSRRMMAHSLALIPVERRKAGFFVGNMIPTVIDEDRKAAAAVHRKTMTTYVSLPNYRQYWKAAGYVEEMEAIEEALAQGDGERIPSMMTERWLSDCTLYGSADEVREGVERWYDVGVTTPILVPSSTSGGQMKAFEELFAAFA